MACLATVGACAVLSSCSGLIYDGEGDCDPYYKVRFRYDWNMKFADAFPKEVLDVTLYVVDDNTGKVVWQKRESGEALQSEGYMMDVPVGPGTYSLVAWCGEGHRTSFSVDESDVKTELMCHLAVGDSDESGLHVKEDLNRLYHGTLEGQDFPDSQGTHIYTVPLKKNTNDVHVVLQHLSGDLVDASKFSFEISDANAHMAWNNELCSDDPVFYHAWNVMQGSAGLDTDTRAITSMSAAVADLTVGRLHEDSATRLNVRNDKGETVISVPLIEYFLLVKGHYRQMADQEYLDRQDDYNLVFFLDEDDRWINSHIYINSWHVVLQQEDIK